METCIHCGCEVHPKRVEILNKTHAPITCLEHSTTEAVKGFQANFGKTEYYIEVVTPAQGARLQKLERKTGGATGGPGIPVFGREPGKVVYKPKDPKNPKP